MENKNVVTSIIIELEISIKLLEYLKRNTIIDDQIYNYVVNKLIKKIELEKSKINDNIKDYKILT